MNKTIKGIDCITNKTVCIELEDGNISSLKYSKDNPEGDIYMGPGLTDLQVNGFAGIDFNTFPISEEGMIKVINALVKEGVTTFLPTIITNSDSAILSLLKNIDDLCTQSPQINTHVGGIHLEGPFISKEDGARGAHDKKFVKAPDWELFQMFQKASGSRIKIVTISPEWDNCGSFIKKCVKNNILVSIGHTNATPEQIRNAVNAGARMSTHLGNGAALMQPRTMNFIYEQLADERLTASLIADGFHLPDCFLKVALKVKQDNAILVSDSTMFAGMASGVYNSHIGGNVLLEENGRLCLKNNSNMLAGAALSILDGINKLLISDIADLGSAWSLASVNPNRITGNSTQYSELTETSDLILFRINKNKISILDVFKNGILIYSANSEKW